MALDLNNFRCGRTCYCSTGPNPDQVMHGYGSSSDTLATIAASAYFNSAYTVFNSTDKFRQGDLIMVKDSVDDAQIYKVTAVTPDVTVAVI